MRTPLCRASWEVAAAEAAVATTSKQLLRLLKFITSEAEAAVDTVVDTGAVTEAVTEADTVSNFLLYFSRDECH